MNVVSRITPVSRSRSAVTIIEILATVSVLAIWTTMTIPFLIQLSSTRQAVANRELALRELRNQVELFRAFPDRELTLSKETAEHLENPELSLSSTKLKDTNITEHRIAISWENQNGQRTRPVQLTTWTFNRPDRNEEGVQP